MRQIAQCQTLNLTILDNCLYCVILYKNPSRGKLAHREPIFRGLRVLALLSQYVLNSLMYATETATNFTPV